MSYSLAFIRDVGMQIHSLYESPASPSPIVVDREDVKAWGLKTSGIIDIKSTYSLAINLKDNILVEREESFKWIWHSRCHKKLQLLLWFCFSHGVPYRVKLVARGITISATCPICNRESENILSISFGIATLSERFGKG
ncbi:putative ribonuclease h protein [Senna tora]|uniref:Putative ribonuclease h protein n=1 Tax=Senna tora TaxID=362788 RepID=A0A834TRC1_9FABA|nr:putative ribonuclease h protein [Senna tora]